MVIIDHILGELTYWKQSKKPI